MVKYRIIVFTQKNEGSDVLPIKSRYIENNKRFM